MNIPLEKIGITSLLLMWPTRRPPSLLIYMCLGLQNAWFMLFTHGGTFPRREGGGGGTQLCYGLVLGPLLKGCPHPHSWYTLHTFHKFCHWNSQTTKQRSYKVRPSCPLQGQPLMQTSILICPSSTLKPHIGGLAHYPDT